MNHHPPNPTTLRDRMLAAGFAPCDCAGVRDEVRADLLHSPTGLHAAPEGPHGEGVLARYVKAHPQARPAVSVGGGIPPGLAVPATTTEAALAHCIEGSDVLYGGVLEGPLGRDPSPLFSPARAQHLIDELAALVGLAAERLSPDGHTAAVCRLKGDTWRLAARGDEEYAKERAAYWDEQLKAILG
jgi:hypothetical protein